MSNRNFDASSITRRNGNKAVAKSILSNMSSATPYFFQPLNSNTATSVINEVALGNSQYILKGTTCTTVDPGCPCPSPAVIPPISPVIPENIGGAQWSTYLFTKLSSVGGSATLNSLATSVDGSIYGTGFYTTFNPNQPSLMDGLTAPSWQQLSSDPEVTFNYTSPPNPALPQGIGIVYLVKYAPTGEAVAAVSFGLGTSGVNDQGYSVAVTPDGEYIYVTGIIKRGGAMQVPEYNATGQQTASSITLDIGVTESQQNMFLIKYTKDLQPVWATMMKSPTPTNTSRGRAVALDASGNVYVTGTYIGTITLYSARLTANPSPVSPSTAWQDAVTGITLAAETTNDTFVVKYDANGVLQRATRIGSNGIGQFVDTGLSIAISSNTIYVGGTYAQQNNTAGAYDATSSGQASSPTVTFPATGSTTTTAVYLVQYNTNLEVTRATSFNGEGTGQEDYRTAVRVANGNVYLAGYYKKSTLVTLYEGVQTGSTQTTSSPITLPNLSGGTSGYLIKFNSQLVVQWATIVYDASLSAEEIRSIAIDSLENIYVSGRRASGSTASIVYDASSSSPYQVLNMTPACILPNNNNSALSYLIKYNFNGIAQWMTYFQASSTNIGETVVVDQNNTVYWGGSYTDSTTSVVVNNAGTPGAGGTNPIPEPNGMTITLTATTFNVRSYLICYK